MDRAVRKTEQEKAREFFTGPSGSHVFINSGCTMVDCIIGGGWPLGRMSNIVGDKSTGKTLLAIEAMTNFARQFPNGKIWYREAEAAFDFDYANALGLPQDRIGFKDDMDTVEQFADDLKACVEEASEENVPGLYVLDSLDALSDKAEMERKTGQATFGQDKAKQLSVMFRKLVRLLRRSNTHLMIISQVRDNIGVMFGKKHRRSGGHAMDFYASQVLWLALVEKIKRTKGGKKDGIHRVVGIRIKANCDKNKIGQPFRDCEFDIRFGYGIEDAEASVDWLEQVKVYSPVEDLSTDELLKALRKSEPSVARSLKKQLDALVYEQWRVVEKHFLPEKRKY